MFPVSVRGRAHLSPSQAEVIRKWSTLVKFTLEYGPPIAEGILMMEKTKKVDLYHHLRGVRSLLSKEARDAAAALLMSGPTVKVFESAVEKLVHAQWVEFHWHDDNPNIHPEQRVFLPTSCCVGCSLNSFPGSLMSALNLQFVGFCARSRTAF